MGGVGLVGWVILIRIMGLMAALFFALLMVTAHYMARRSRKIWKRLRLLTQRQPQFRSPAEIGEFAAALRQISEDSQRPVWLHRTLAYIAKAGLDSERNRQFVTKHIEMIAAGMDAIDHYTWKHSQSVSRLAQQIARQMDLPDSQIEEVRQGGIIHDVGKIGVPEPVLNKPSALTPEEYELMKSHTVLGAKILEPLKRERYAYYRVYPSAVKTIEGIRGIVRNHHERWDGTGYPDGLKGEQIPLGARIVAVANAFDTMCSKTAYKGERTVEEAVAELRRCSGTQFDPKVVDVFLSTPEDTWKKIRAEAALKVGPKASVDSEPDLQR